MWRMRMTRTARTKTTRRRTKRSYRLQRRFILELQNGNKQIFSIFLDCFTLIRNYTTRIPLSHPNTRCTNQQLIIILHRLEKLELSISAAMKKVFNFSYHQINSQLFVLNSITETLNPLLTVSSPSCLVMRRKTRFWCQKSHSSLWFHTQNVILLQIDRQFQNNVGLVSPNGHCSSD